LLKQLMYNIMSLLRRSMDNLSPQQHDIYLISDTHFDEPWFSCHRGLGRHCGFSRPCWFSGDQWFYSRCPFNDTAEMNKILVDNWNNTVRKDDTVYFLGDWSDSNRWYWRDKKLNGKLISIKGNHDLGTRAEYTTILKTAKREYLLVHNPFYGRHYPGWVIHGHYHNNDFYNYPFINGYSKTKNGDYKPRTINVSVEVIGYKPISINWIEALHLSTIKEMNTFDSVPVRWRHARR